ncbi:MAG TPA: YraN family protein [Vicinamibacterales bacterium]|nr:YraN family protein [Vicinamibacterales bacterium]
MDRGLLPWTGIVTHARQTLGKHGEDLACRELERRGYAIVARRYRRRGGEIDIVARDGDTVVFVEVKAREDLAFGGGADAVTAIKRRRIAQIAREYLACHHRSDCPCRFDVVSIQFDAGRPVVELFQNAFDA